MDNKAVATELLKLAKTLIKEAGKPISNSRRYVITLGNGKEITMKGTFLKSALKDGNMDIASWVEA